MVGLSPILLVPLLWLGSGAVFASGPRPTEAAQHRISTQLSIGQAGISLHLIIR